ncbi:MAG: transglycosylase domain-containing protein [Akkermansia sp.]|nr:transglycosylase domain-containing protein [Akkermansia sp.]
MNIRRTTGRILLCAAAIATAAAGVYYALPFCVNAPDISPPPPAAVYDRHGELMGYVAGEDGYFCQPLTTLPDELARAIISAEDKRFYNHGGVDAAAVLRALRNRLLRKQRGGASTISMQVAKMYNAPSPRNWRTKIKETLQARRLEMTHSKEELLLAYLNRADFSNRCRGAECAARFYFGKSAADLDIAQAALLAALVKAPTRLNPMRHPQEALERRDYILKSLGQPQPQAELQLHGHSIAAPAQALGRAGQLTLDSRLQKSVAAIAREEITKLKQHNVSQAAVMVLDNRSGEVLVSLPAALPESSRGGALNGTITPRSAGSTLKPFVYLYSFSHGAWPGTIMADVPTLYRDKHGVQAPGNYNNRYLGPITIRRALACSQNIPAMQALNLYGSENELLVQLRRLAFAIPGNAEEYGLGLTIGNAHVTLTELVQAYSTLARNGNSLLQQFRLPLVPISPTELLPEADCYRIADILSDASARATTFGSAPALRFPYRVAVKTGTSSNYRDNWCLGFTAEYTVGVWVGNFDNSSMKGISGVSGAAPIFHRVMELMHTDTPATFPNRPEGLTEITIDTRTGTPATNQTPPECLATELATSADIAAMKPAHYDGNGRAVLDSRYSQWYKTAGLSHLYALDATAPSARRSAILIPSPGTTVTLDATLPHNGRWLELSSTLPEATASWYCRTLPTVQRNGKWYAVLRPGTHTLRVTAPPALEASSTFHVSE